MITCEPSTARERALAHLPGFTLPDELRLLRDQVRRFAQAGSSHWSSGSIRMRRISCARIEKDAIRALQEGHETLWPIGEGPSEVRSMVIARSLLR